MHRSPEAIGWLQDDEFVEAMLAPKPIKPWQVIVGLVALIAVGAVLFFAVKDGLKAERGSEPVLLQNNLSYCYFWDGAKLSLSRSPSSECRP